MELSEEQWSAVLGRLESLEKRMNSVEAVEFKRGELSRAIRGLVESWSGPFTARQLREVLSTQRPEILPEKEWYQIEAYCRKLVKWGEVIERQKGAGPHGTVYERLKSGPIVVARGGPKMGHKRPYESGARSIFRQALEDMPEEFTIADLRAWVEKRKHDLPFIPFGTWSSTLYKLQCTGELVCIRGGRKQRLGNKVFKRGERRVTADGGLRSELETAYRDFRKSNIDNKAAGVAVCKDPEERTAESGLQEMEKDWAKYREKMERRNHA